MTAALRNWFLGSDSYWRAYGIDTAVNGGVGSIVDAQFTATVSGKTVTVDGSASTAVGATIVSYGWDFGDGTTAVGVTPAPHLYATAGSYTITLTVTDSLDHSDTATSAVSVVAPVAAFTWTASASTASFDATGSVSVGSTIARYGWDFGDGTTGTGATASHTYATAGTRAVTLTVTDAAGNADTTTRQVTVALPVSNPVAAFTDAVSNYVATFDGSPSTTTNATITGYAWTYGDGATGTGRTSQHTYAAGNWTATLTITDSQGRTATVSHLVTVLTPANQPPVAAFTATPTGLTVGFSAVTSTDGDGSIASYAWTFGDGGTGTGVNPTHTYTAGGSFLVRLIVTDNLGATGTVTKTITVTQPQVGTDYITGAASGSTTLVPASTAAVLQDFVRSPDTGEFYSSQVHPESDGITQSTRISRMTSSGTLIDQMMLTAAGHGTVFALEYSGGQVYLWVTWQRATVGGTVIDDVVRFPYKTGTYLKAQVTGLTTVIPGGGAYRHVAFDWMNGYACIRTSSGTTDTYRRHKLTDVLVGNLSTPLNTIALRQSTNFGVDGYPTMQGFASYANGFFRYTGAPTDIVGGDPRRITEYDWATGTVVRTLDTSAFGGTGQKLEPEGMSLYDTGSSPVLYFGVTQGPSGGPHTYPTWRYPLLDTTTATQPTGPGISRYQDLTGSTFNAKITAAPTTSSVSFPAGTIEFSNFAVQTYYGAVYSGRGLLGSGPDATIIRMKASTSTKASLVPTASGTTNPLYLIRSTSTASGVRYDGFHLQGTSQGHLYNGLRLSSQVAPVLNNLKVSAVPGNSAINPGETFHVNLANCSAVKATNVTLDGAAVGASGFGANSCTGGQSYTDVTVTGMKYCKAWAGWQCAGGATFTRFNAAGNAFAFGFERCSGTYTLNRCTFGSATRADIHLASDTTARATVVINDPVLPSGKTTIKVLLPATELGNPNLQTRSDIKVFVGGVDKSSTMLTFVTSA